jgi:hypothetical protein
MDTKLTLAGAKKELTKLNVEFDKNSDLKTLTDLLSESIDAEKVNSLKNADEIVKKTKPKGKLKTVVIESSFYDGNTIYRTGKTIDVTEKFFKKYEIYFKKEAKKVKLAKID